MKKPATTSVVIEGAHHRAFAERVRAKIAEVLGLVEPSPVTARVIFADENGPKGGPGIRCTMVTDMPRRREVSVTELAPTEELAFDAAIDALETSITRDRKRRRTLVRHPKKYYLAKRLLAPGITAGPRPKRARRRRVA